LVFHEGSELTTATHPDPCRVVCAGDWITAPRIGATGTLERLCRIGQPHRGWTFWHLGDAQTTADALLREAIWKALGLGAGRLILSLGGAEAFQDDFDPQATAENIRRCMVLLADKGPQELFLILPCPSLWPWAKRPMVEALREALLPVVGKWTLIDLERRANAFLEAQSRHPDQAAALVEDSDSGPSLTSLGALLVADEVHGALSE
jgi:hypothetical protein